MAIYKLNKHSTESEPSSVTLDKGNGIFVCIPFDEANADYQEYLKWLNGEDPYTEKGTPDPVS